MKKLKRYLIWGSVFALALATLGFMLYLTISNISNYASVINNIKELGGAGTAILKDSLANANHWLAINWITMILSTPIILGTAYYALKRLLKKKK